VCYSERIEEKHKVRRREKHEARRREKHEEKKLDCRWDEGKKEKEILVRDGNLWYYYSFHFYWSC
jgi:hypothetical protein